MQVCQSYADMSTIIGFVKVIRVCQSYADMSKLFGYIKLHGSDVLLYTSVTLTRKCQIKGMSNFQFKGIHHRNVKYVTLFRECPFSRKCHTFKGMSHFQEIVQLSTSKGNSNFQGNITLQGNVTLSWEYQTF